MNRWMLALTVLAIGFATPALAQQQAAPRIDSEAALAAAAARGEVVFVDVRTDEEVAEGAVAGAIHIPVDQMDARWTELQQYRDRPVVLYCRTGNRSGRAIEILQGKGFVDLVNGGGFEGLVAAGVEVER